MEDDERHFAELWRHREDVLYPAMFGPAGHPGIWVPTVGLLERSGATFIDPRWCTYGVHAYGPCPGRDTTLYVTHGLSLPWDDYGRVDWDAEGPSGLGYEIVLETRRQSAWALDLALQILAYAILIAHGALPRPAPEPVLHHGSRVTWHGPVDGSPRGRLRNLIALAPPSVPGGFETDAGTVAILQVACVSDREIAYARSEGSQALIDLLVLHGGITVAPRRKDVPMPMPLEPPDAGPAQVRAGIPSR